MGSIPPKSGPESGNLVSILALDAGAKKRFFIFVDKLSTIVDNLSTKKRQICSNTSQEHRAYLIWSRLRRKSGPYMV